MERENYPRILIVDDEEYSILLMESLIRKHYPGIKNIVSLHKVNEALIYLQSNSIDILLLDIELKGSSGFDLLDKIPQRDFEFICLSASKEYAFKTFEYGGAGYLLKPVNGEELVVVLDRVVGKSVLNPMHCLRLRSD